MSQQPRSPASQAERRAALEARHPAWTPVPLHGALDAAADRWPDRPLVITDAQICTYAQVRDWSLRLARGLAGAGAAPGRHVALEMANYPEYVATKFAISRTGATCVPTNVFSRRDEFAYVLAQSRASLLILMARHGDLDYLAMLDDIAPGWPTEGGGSALPNLRRVVVFDNDGQGVPTDAHTLADLDAANVLLPPDVDPFTTADILYTSGTTGDPKGVLLTHDMLLRAAYGAAHARGFEDGRRIHVALPMYHVFGYVEGLLPVLFVGGAVVPHVDFDAAASLDAIERHRATDMLATPLMTRVLLEARAQRAAEGHPADLSSLASLICSGIAESHTVWDRVGADLPDVEVATGYGTTETTAFATGTRPDDPPHRRRTTAGRLRDVGVVGDPDLGGRLVVLRVVDPETGREAGRAAVGELQAYGSGVTVGYWDNPAATDAAFTADGWLRTGDLGTIDADGYLTLAGRAEDCYHRGGEQTPSKDVDGVLLEHPANGAPPVEGLIHRDVPVGFELIGVKKKATAQLMGSRLWGRYNPTHWDPASAAQTGLAAPIQTGEMSSAYLSEMCVTYFGANFFRNARMSCKYVAATIANEEITTHGVVREKIPRGDGFRFVVDVWAQNAAGEKKTVGFVEVDVGV